MREKTPPCRSAWGWDGRHLLPCVVGILFCTKNRAVSVPNPCQNRVVSVVFPCFNLAVTLLSFGVHDGCLTVFTLHCLCRGDAPVYVAQLPVYASGMLCAVVGLNRCIDVLCSCLDVFLPCHSRMVSIISWPSTLMACTDMVRSISCSCAGVMNHAPVRT